MDYWPCDSCAMPVIAELAYADMETLTLLCPECLKRKLKPCEVCGTKIRSAAYQHLPTGRVVCEPCVLSKGAGADG